MHKPTRHFFAFLILVLAVSLVRVPASAAAPPPATSPSAAAAGSFPDTVGLWDAADVSLLVRAGVIRGEPSGRFNPDGPLTRAQLAALLTRTLSLPVAKPPVPPFKDVQAGFWGEAVVQAVYAAHIMEGVGQGMFLPDAPVTRAQTVTALARALHLKLKGGALPFTDAAKIPAWAAPAVVAMVSAKLVAGYPDGSFKPDATLNRAQAAHLFAEVFRRIHAVAAPQGVYLTTYRDHVDVVWRPSSGADSYAIERQAPGGPWTPVGSTTDRVWGDYHADPTVAYAYRVVAVGLLGLRSKPSQAVSEPALSPFEQGFPSADHYSVATKIGLTAALSAGPGAAFGLGGLALGSLPATTLKETPGNGPTELFSDNPETATTSEILYQDTASGRLRLYYDHTNGTGGPAHFVVYLSNPGQQPVSYQFYSYSEATTGGPKAEGEKVAETLLAPPQPIISAGSIQPGEFLELDPTAAAITVPAGDSVQGSYDVAVNGPMTVSFAMVSASLGDPYTVFAQHKLPMAKTTTATGDGAGRGTFPNATRDLALTLDPGKITSFLLADGKSDPYLTGRDATTGGTATLYGNYGVVYHLTGTPKVDTALVAVPVGGQYYGALSTGGKVYTAPKRVLPSDGSTGFLMAVWKAGQSNELDWVPPAGSYLPLQVLAIPLSAS